MYDQLAPYYDRLYANKDYKKECEFLKTVFRHCKVDPKTILDIGCGTGTHCSELSNLGYGAHGIDISPEMISIAKCKYSNGSFSIADVRDMKEPLLFDVAISMFGTMTYLTKPADFIQALKSINKALKPGGLFIFDGWNSFAVSRVSPPNGRMEEINDELFKYVEMYPSAERYIASSKFVLFDLATKKVIKNDTNLLLFTKMMIKEVLEIEGFELLFYWKAFQPGTSPATEDWKVSVVARKK